MTVFHLSETSSWVRTEPSQGQDLDPGPPVGDATLDALLTNCSCAAECLVVLPALGVLSPGSVLHIPQSGDVV